MTDHVKFPSTKSSDISEGQARFDEFEKYLLHNWSTMLANPTMWFVLFDNLPLGLKGMSTDNIVNKEGPNQYDQYDENQINLMTAIENRIGCFLVHGVTLPTIEVEANRADPVMGGYYGGLVSNQVKEQNIVTLELRETHSSAVDFLIRPWVEMVAKNGFIARSPSDPRRVKTNMLVVKTAKAGPGTDPVKRKMWQFYNCAPISVSNHSLSHDGTWQAPDVFINTNWTYTHYKLTDVRHENISAIYKSHIEDPAIRPATGTRTSGRVGDTDTPSGEITVS